MSSNNLIQQLQERELISQSTNEDKLNKKLTQKSISLYCGFDPTASSLHLGHLIPLICLMRFQCAGHKPIALIGGATGLIGDPSFKFVERKLNTNDIINHWIDNISKQISLFLDFNCGSNSAIIVNNYNWFANMNILTFLRDIGKHFSINQMINKEAIKQRLNRNDHGISFTEFSYNLLQSYDFAYLNKLYGVTLQIGGSDQWGNIISGIDLTRRINKNHVFGLTVPLITKFDGTKFGKTEDGTIWLDPKKTSPYKFYQFWINIADNDVYRFLQLFTFLSNEEINSLKEKMDTNTIPYAKYILADHVTKLVHNKDGLAAAKRITNNLFNGSINNLLEEDFKQLSQDGIPTIILNINNILLQQVLVESKLVTSRNQARTMITANAIAINGKKENKIDYYLKDIDILFNKYTMLSRGKKNFCLIEWKNTDLM